MFRLGLIENARRKAVGLIGHGNVKTLEGAGLVVMERDALLGTAELKTENDRFRKALERIVELETGFDRWGGYSSEVGKVALDALYDRQPPQAKGL